MSLLAFRAGLRGAARRRLEGAALLAITALVVFLYGFVSLAAGNMERHVYLQVRDRMGDVLVVGVFSDGDVEAVASLPGVAEVRPLKVLFGLLDSGGGRQVVAVVPASLVDGVKAKVVEGRAPGEPGEALVYWSLSGPPLDSPPARPGDLATLTLYTLDGLRVEETVEVVGTARGFEWLGGRRVSVALHDSVVDELLGGRYTGLAVYAADPEGDIDGLALRVVETLRQRGATVSWHLTSDPDRNPITALLRGALSVFTVPSSLLLVLTAVLPAAAGAALAARESRVVAVLRAQGAGARVAATMLSAPWLAWGAAGALLGAAAAAAASPGIYARVFVGDSEIAGVLYESYGFQVPPSTVARAVAAGLAGVATGSLAPLAVALSVKTAAALRSGELPVQLVPPRIRLPGPALALAALRDAAARPWKLAGAAVALGVVWGIAGGMAALQAGLDEVVETYSDEDSMPPDVYVSVESLAPDPPEPAWRALEEAVAGALGQDTLKGYTITARVEVVDALGLSEFSYLTAVMAGDPSVAFPLLEGRHPRGPGEAVVSRALAAMLGLGVGDRLWLDLDSGAFEAVVVGISSSRVENGFYVLVEPGWLGELAGGSPGESEAVAHIDLAPGVDPERALESLRGAVEARGYLAVRAELTRQDIVDSIERLGLLLRGVMGGMLLLASAAAGLAVAALAVVDVSSRAREHAALLAAGAPPGALAAGYALHTTVSLLLAAPLAYASARLVSGLVAERSALAVGYVIPHLGPGELLDPQTLAPAILLGAAASWIAAWRAISRLDLPSLLRE